MRARPVFLTPHLDVVGGTERQLILLVESFARRGILVPVVTRRPVFSLPRLPGPISTYAHPLQDLLQTMRPLRARLRLGRAQTVERAEAYAATPATPAALDDGSRPNLLRRLVDHGLATRIAELTASSLGPPTVIHLHGTFFHAMCRGAAMAARRNRIPLVVKIANEPERVLTQLRRDPRAYDAVKQAAALIVVSEDARRRFESLALGPRIFHVPNAVELPDALPARAEGGPLLYVGTLKPQKGVDVLLEAWARVPSHLRSRQSLRIVGDGAERAALEATATRLGISPSTVFVGAVGDVTEELRRASAFVLPSRWEGMPNALLEAMAHRLPCIATDIAGCRDLLAPTDAGWLVPAEDADALARSIEETLTDPTTSQRRALAARAFVEAHHAPSRIVDRLLETYAAVGG